MKKPGIASRGMFFVFFILLMFPAGALAHKLPADFRGFADSASCAPCHKTIYDEWSRSMHSMSDRKSDTAHNAVFLAFSQFMAKSGKKAPYFCGSCHAPAEGRLTAGAKTVYSYLPDIPCAFCHSVEGVSEGKAFNTYSLSAAMTSAGAVSGTSAPHPVSKWSFESPSGMCLGCHGKMKNGKGTVICSMDMEGHADCVRCHMEEKAGPPAAGSGKTSHFSHLFPGGHDKDMLKKGVSLSLEASNGKLLVNIKNKAPHFFPSTSPMRAAFVKVEIFDKTGKAFPEKSGGMTTFMRVFTAGGKKGAPPWMAEKAVDSRIKAGETRTLTYDIPVGAVRASAAIYYRLFTPPAAAKFGIPAKDAAPVKVAEKAIDLDSR